MTEEEERELRKQVEDLTKWAHQANAQVSNIMEMTAHLYEGLDAAGSISVLMPRVIAPTSNDDRSVAMERLQEALNRLKSALEKAHDCYWTEDGKPKPAPEE